MPCPPTHIQHAPAPQSRDPLNLADRVMIDGPIEQMGFQCIQQAMHPVSITCLVKGVILRICDQEFLLRRHRV